MVIWFIKGQGVDPVDYYLVHEKRDRYRIEVDLRPYQTNLHACAIILRAWQHGDIVRLESDLILRYGRKVDTLPEGMSELTQHIQNLVRAEEQRAY